MTRSPAMPLAVPAPDADLLAAVAHGDRSALGELARRYVDFVYAAAVRQLGDRHAAEDVTQAVFLVLARKAGRVRAGALAAWLHQTTVYAAANARRAARRRRRHELAAARSEADMSQTPPDAATQNLLARLDEAIAALPAKDRIAVCGRYLRGDDLAAVAAALGTTPAAAQKRIERAVEALRRGLESGVAGTGRPAAVTPTALLGALAVAAASPSGAGTAALAVMAASPSAVSTAKGVIIMMTFSKSKIIGVLVAVVLAAGLTAEAARRFIAAAPASVPATRPATPEPPGPPPDAAADQAAMQGEWEIVATALGQGTQQNGPTPGRLTITGDRLAMPGAPADAAMTFTLDPAHSNKWIECRHADGGNVIGIYDITGDTMRLRFGGKAHDLGFDAPPSADAGLMMTLRRAKPAARPASATATFPDGVSVELIAIGDPIAGQWWTPDGKPTTPPAGVDDKPDTGKPEAGERRLSFVTEIRGTAGQGDARGRLQPQPERPLRFTMWTPQLPGPGRRSRTDLIIDAAAPIGFHVDVSTAAPQSLTLLRGQRTDWAPFAAGELKSPGGITYTLSKPQAYDGHPAFEISPYDREQYPFDNVTLVLIGPDGGEWPCALKPVENAGPPKLLAWSSLWTLPEVSAARMTLRRYDRGVDFTGFAMRPGESATPTATGYAQSGPRDPGR